MVPSAERIPDLSTTYIEVSVLVPHGQCPGTPHPGGREELRGEEGRGGIGGRILEVLISRNKTGGRMLVVPSSRGHARLERTTRVMCAGTPHPEIRDHIQSSPSSHVRILDRVMRFVRWCTHGADCRTYPSSAYHLCRGQCLGAPRVLVLQWEGI
jgi:hypothetical protein